MDSSDINSKLSAAFHEAMHYFADRANWKTESFKDNVEVYSIPSRLGINVVIGQIMLSKTPIQILDFIDDDCSRPLWDTMFGKSRLIRNDQEYKVLHVQNKAAGISRSRDFIVARKRMMVGDSHVSVTTSVTIPEEPKPSFFTVRGEVIFLLWMVKASEDGRSCVTCMWLLDPRGLIIHPIVNSYYLRRIQKMKLLKEAIENLD